eukprot:scaffold74966_cov61-Phaeocystis_antarctica.AAC.1
MLWSDFAAVGRAHRESRAAGFDGCAPTQPATLRSTQKSPPAAPSGGGDDASGGGVHVIRRRTHASTDGLLRGLR